MNDKTLGIFQFKREKANKGESHKKYYVEIVAESLIDALMKIKQTGIDNLRWRWIDSYDCSSYNYDITSFTCVLENPVGFNQEPIEYDQDLFYAPKENLIFIRTYILENNQIFCKIEDKDGISIKEFDNNKMQKVYSLKHIGKMYSIFDIMSDNNQTL